MRYNPRDSRNPPPAMHLTKPLARHGCPPPGSPLIVLALGLLAGCSAGSGDGLDVSGRPLAEGGDVPLAPTLESIQANVFNPFCIVCHAGAGAPLGLKLDAVNSHANLVGVPSRQDSSLLRVSPGEPDQSYLIQKLEGTASTGGQMPLGGPLLPAATIEFVRQWIIDGAQPGGGTAPLTPPTVVSLTPDPDSIIGALPEQITAGFDRELDASTVNNLTFTLTRSGGDGQFGDMNDVPVAPASVGLSPVNPRLAVMDLTGVTSVEDRYRILLSGSGANRILDNDGRALDGEFGGTFPSGDGMEGGDFAADFEVLGMQPALASIQSNVFTPLCAACHSGPTGPTQPAGMDLSSEAESFASLVSVPSDQQPEILRVAPGNADASYLVQKLEGTAAVGERMPQGGPFLDQATIDVIRAWIDQGAAP
ncbi:MAG: Ig-like domain-containing protein [Woeseiaceae bacterium]